MVPTAPSVVQTADAEVVLTALDDDLSAIQQHLRTEIDRAIAAGQVPR